MYYAVRDKSDETKFVNQRDGLVGFLNCTIFHFEKKETLLTFARELAPQLELVHVEFRPVTNASLFN